MMKTGSLVAIALVLAVHSAPVGAQSMDMLGMNMPMPAKPTPKKKASAKKRAEPKRPAALKQSGATRLSRAHADKPASTMPDMVMPPRHDAMPGNPPATGQAVAPMNMPMSAAPMDHMTMPAEPHAGHGMTMNGALGHYPMMRESSGTAWQPDSSEHPGLMIASGDWTLMGHGVLNFVLDDQSGRRGGDKAFASGMLMGMAQRPLGDGTLQFKAMISPDPLMGPRGYPLLLASGETADGVHRLIDRQHPHDLFMELSGSISQNIGGSSVFLYGGLPGEPAFGPPAFMHREAIMDSPEAPITHHWLDSTHITFGVITAGLVHDRFKVEASRFNAREPDQHRWDIETGPLDSTSVRLSWNPNRAISLQGSWGRFTSPEQLEPGVNQTRWSASALWADEVAPGWKTAATLAWGRKSALGDSDDGVAAEASVKHRQWTVFGRGEIIENRELTNLENGPSYRVGKVSAGVIRDFRLADHLSAGIGGLVSLNFVPDALAPLYAGNHPTGAMGYVRVKFD